MAGKPKSIHELIRRILDGRGTRSARKALVASGPEGIDPVLDALAGEHGRFHPDDPKAATDALVNTLEHLAVKHPGAMAERLAHGGRAINLVTWALGHSSSPQARRALESLSAMGDPALDAVIEYHRQRGGRSRRAKPAAKGKAKGRAKKKPAKKRPARNKKRARKR